MSNVSSVTHTNNVNIMSQATVATDDLSEKDFVILYPSGKHDGGLAQAILALYYLPPHFKLKVLADSAAAQKMALGEYDTVRSRISVESDAASPSAAQSFSHIDAVLYNENTPVRSESSMPQVVISESTDESLIKGAGDKFTISADSPEALASAMLRIAKAA